MYQLRSVLFIIAIVTGVSAQDLTFEKFRAGNVTFPYPSGWTTASNESSAVFIGPNGRTKLSSGRDWITRGIIFAETEALSDIAKTSESVLTRLQAENPNMRALGSWQPVGFQNAIGRQMPFVNSDIGVQERGVLVVALASHKAFFWAIFCPETEQNTVDVIRQRIAHESDFSQAIGSQPEIRVFVEPAVTLVRTTIAVPAGRNIAYPFALERGSQLAVDLRVRGGLNNRVDLYLLDTANYQRFMAGQQFQFFQGTSGAVQNVVKYTFQVPRTDNYHLVIDNRRAWLLNRNVQLYAYAVLTKPTAESRKAEEAAKQLYIGLRNMFVFPDFQLSFRHCGFVNAFSDPNITMCTELLNELSAKQLESAAFFVLFHELGHTLIRQWGLPGWDNEDMADEFATVFMMMSKQDGAALAAARHWADQTSREEAEYLLWNDDRHTLSPQRARNIIRWLNQREDLLKRWQRLMVPHMQTAFLESIAREKEPDFDQFLVVDELQRRNSPSQAAR